MFVDPTKAVFMLGWLQLQQLSLDCNIRASAITEQFNSGETCFEISYSSQMEFSESGSVLEHAER